MVITFTSVFADSRLQKRFFRKLKEDGVPVRFEGNELSAAAKAGYVPTGAQGIDLARGRGGKGHTHGKAGGQHRGGRSEAESVIMSVAAEAGKRN
ncbi:MAG: hypothetical protein ACLUD2_16725 [Clostridium sp.]